MAQENNVDNNYMEIINVIDNYVTLPIEVSIIYNCYFN